MYWPYPAHLAPRHHGTSPIIHANTEPAVHPVQLPPLRDPPSPIHKLYSIPTPVLCTTAIQSTGLRPTYLTTTRTTDSRYRWRRRGYHEDRPTGHTNHTI